jgi:hypothetical protein
MTDRIAICVTSDSQWSVLRLVAQRLEQSDCSTVIVCSAHVRAKLEMSHPQLALESHCSTEAILAPKSFYSRAKRLKERVRSGISCSFYKEFLAEWRSRIGYYQAMLSRIRPSMLLVPESEDGISGEIWLISAARSLHIPVVVIPYEASGREDFINLIAQRHQNGIANHVGHRARKRLQQVDEEIWILNGERGATSVYPVEYILALHESGIRIPNPWTTHGGEADILAVESDGMEEHYLREGVRAEKLKLTGSPYADRLHSQLMVSSRLSTAYEAGEKIDPTKTRILVSLPPNYHDQRGRLCPYPSYEAMCAAIVRDFSRLDNVQVTVVIHPAHGGQADLLNGLADIELSSEWVLDLIPKHDIFVTSGSSTLRWAVAARKPSINLDYYRFRLEFFDHLAGVTTVESPSEAIHLAQSLITDHEMYRHVTQQQIAIGHKWGIMDGKNNDRVVDMIKRIAS